jgi:pilus assembly protein CpaB
MKRGIIVILILGVAAAVCAAILVGTLRADSAAVGANASSSSIEVAMAKVSLPAMSVITSDHIVEHTALRDKLPQGRLCTAAQAVGRVLAVPVVRGQILTESCFVTEGNGALVAAALPHGMRAVSVTLSRASLSGGLLYPGCVVDVLVSFKVPYAERVNGQGVSTTLLHGIQVLAVEDDSIVSKKEGKVEERLPGGRAANMRVTVTLMVDPRQAEALQLAAENGSISLAMRNPLDKIPVDVDAMVLSQGRLARLGSTLTPAVLAAQTKTTVLAEPAIGNQDSLNPNQKVNPAPLPRQISIERRRFFERPSAGGADLTESSPHWEVTVIRGREVKLEKLAVEEDEDSSDKGAEE